MIRFLVALIEDRRVALAAAGALAVVAGSAAPWAHVRLGPLTFTVLGLETDGKITILLGGLALALTVAYGFLRHRDLAVGLVCSGLASAGLAIAYELNLRRASEEVADRLLRVSPDATALSSAARTGIGLWACIGGATALVVAAGALALARRDRVRSAERA